MILDVVTIIYLHLCAVYLLLSLVKKAQPTDVIEDLLLSEQGKSLPPLRKLLMIIANIIQLEMKAI